jgi:flagellar basal-body rod protein FlgF
MGNTSLIGLSRQIALHRELEVVANNVANINTTGYKADGAVFHEYLMPGARHDHFSGSDRRMSYVHDRATWRDFSAGPTVRTGNPLDVSVEGEGFLVVQTPRGERYTRNGALQLNATGQLVTLEGHPVLGDGGPIQFQNTDRDISINGDGSITAREGANTKVDSARGKLRLVRFENSAQLKKDGASLFAAPDGVTPQPPKRARVLQGTIEGSNVRAVVEMARMVEVSRTYSQIGSLLDNHGDMRRDAIDKLAEVPA